MLIISRSNHSGSSRTSGNGSFLSTKMLPEMPVMRHVSGYPGRSDIRICGSWRNSRKDASVGQHKNPGCHMEKFRQNNTFLMNNSPYIAISES
jgi:hypothetical protein